MLTHLVSIVKYCSQAKLGLGFYEMRNSLGLKSLSIIKKVIRREYE